MEDEIQKQKLKRMRKNRDSWRWYPWGYEYYGKSKFIFVTEASDRVVPKRKATNLQRQGKKNVIRERMLKHITTSDEPIPEGAKLSKEAQESLPLMVSTDQKVDDEVAPTAENEISLKISDDVVPSVQNPVCLKVIEGNGYEVVEKDPSAVSTGTLEVFQARQKILEEQNKRRKELLSKVLSDR